MSMTTRQLPVGRFFCFFPVARFVLFVCSFLKLVILFWYVSRLVSYPGSLEGIELGVIHYRSCMHQPKPKQITQQHR